MGLRHLNASVGASFTLSFLVVGVAAVVLHPTLDNAPKVATANPTATKTAGSDSPGDDPRPGASTTVAARAEPHAAQPPRDPVATRSQAARTRTESSSENPTAKLDAPAVAKAPPPQTVRPVSRQRPPGSRPPGSFTDVNDGETLSDVARRVYGSAEATDALWLANRDQVERPNSPLRAGAMLRTP